MTWRLGSLGHAAGLAGPIVQEVRGPASVGGLFRQKVRRGAAVLREVFRFMPAVTGMSPSLRAAFLVRAAFFGLAPLVVVSAMLLGGIMLSWLSALQGAAAVAFAATSVGIVMRPREGSRLRRSLALVALLTLSATTSLLLYPFLGLPKPAKVWLRPEAS